MPRSDHNLGPGNTMWVAGVTRKLAEELALLEQRSPRLVLHRALLRYAESSPEYQDHVEGIAHVATDPAEDARPQRHRRHAA